MSAQFAVFSQALNSREGSLGRFIHDRALYDQFDEAVSNITDATRRIRPILDDVREFTDKISRDPRQLGVKGALDRRQIGTTGVKTSHR